MNETIPSSGAGAVSPVLAEVARSRLAVADLPGNPAKIRLILDLAAELDARGRRRVLDVGCGGKYYPLNLFAPLRHRSSELEVVGIDIAHVEPTAARAREFGFDFMPVEADAHELLDVFPPRSFDVIVSTQVLEHLRRWRHALSVMRDLLRPNGLLLVTSDSGDLRRPAVDLLRLAFKCGYAVAAQRLPPLRAALGSVASGDWEWPPKLEDLRAEALRLELQVERLDRYGLKPLKTMLRAMDGEARVLWLAYEEALARTHRDAGLYRLLYLRARRPE